MLIKEGNLTILTDPGTYTIEEQEKLVGIDLVVFTHEHFDHFHLESLKVILKNNPNAKVVTNHGLGKLLTEGGVVFELLEEGQEKMFAGVSIAGFGCEHAFIHESFPITVNTGYMFANRFFYPGDALVNPKKSVEILAFPVTGPWLKLHEAIAYAEELSPKKSFPVHDWNLKLPGIFHKLPSTVLPTKGIQFIVPEIGKPMEY